MLHLAEIAPPLIVEVPWAVIGLATLAAFLVMLGLKTTYAYTLGAVFDMLARVLTFKVWKFHVNLAGGIEAIDHAIESRLASGLLATETVLGKWWEGQKKIVEWTYDSLVWFAHSTVGAFDSLVHGTIPQAVGNVVAPVKTDLGKLRRALRAEVAHLTRQLVHRAQALEAELTRDFGKAWRGIDNVRGVEIPRVWKWAAGAGAAIAALRKYIHWTVNRRLTRLEKLVVGGALTAAILQVLARAMPWYRCSNVRRFNRALCRSPFGSLDWLFALAALVVTALNPITMAHEGERVVDGLEGILRTMAGVPKP